MNYSLDIEQTGKKELMNGEKINKLKETRNERI